MMNKEQCQECQAREMDTVFITNDEVFTDFETACAYANDKKKSELTEDEINKCLYETLQETTIDSYAGEVK